MDNLPHGHAHGTSIRMSAHVSVHLCNKIGYSVAELRCNVVASNIKQTVPQAPRVSFAAPRQVAVFQSRSVANTPGRVSDRTPGRHAACPPGRLLRCSYSGGTLRPRCGLHLSSIFLLAPFSHSVSSISTKDNRSPLVGLQTCGNTCTQHQPRARHQERGEVKQAVK